MSKLHHKHTPKGKIRQISKPSKKIPNYCSQERKKGVTTNFTTEKGPPYPATSEQKKPPESSP